MSGVRPASRSAVTALRSAVGLSRKPLSAGRRRRLSRPRPSRATALPIDRWASEEAYTTLEPATPVWLAGTLASRAMARPIKFASDPPLVKIPPNPSQPIA